MRTVGVEEELLLVHPVTGVARAVAGRVLGVQAVRGPAAYGHGDGGSLQAELQQQQIETDTRPCEDLGELDRELRSWRRRADEAAREVGARAAALATSPLPVSPQTTPKQRYAKMAQHFGLTTTEQLTCGCHVHVQVTSDEEAVAVVDRVRIWLPALLAISANSPFWQGVDSGYASFRSQAWSRFPTAGPPELFGSAAAYRNLVDAMVASGTVLDRAMVYLDVRPSDSYPTVEFRMADVCMAVEDAVVVSALCRALVDTASHAWQAGDPPPPVPVAMLRLASWRAGRSGTGDDLLDPYTCRPRRAGDVLADLIDHCRDALRRSGDQTLVADGVARVLRSGTGADRQRATNRRSGDLAAVVREAVEVTHHGGDALLR